MPTVEHDNEDGSVHVTTYDPDNNIRYSTDVYETDTGYECRNRHITDQDDNEHADLEPCSLEDDDYM